MSATRKNEFFEGLHDAMTEGIEALREGKVLTTRQVEVVSPKPMTARQITNLRKKKLHVSQAVFASLTNSSRQTIQAWEQGRTKPSGSALRLLWIFDSRPEVVADILHTTRQSKTA